MINSSVLEAGKICNVHGLKGTLKIQPWTDSPEVFESFRYIIIDDVKHKVLSVKYHKSSVLVNLKGIDSIDVAQKYVNKIVYCMKNDLKLSKDTYFVTDLIGCEVISDDGFSGILCNVIRTGSADVYEIKSNEGKDVYIAAIRENILDIDIKNKIIKVRIPEDMN